MTRNNNNYNIYSESNREKRTKRIVMIIIIIFIILFLITSCSCTAKFWGKIGDLFVNEMDVDIDKDRNDLEPIVNRELHFDFDQDGIENKYDFDYEMYVTDEDGKVTYSYFDISPHEFSCTTSDAAIATCYVKKDYVVIRPKKIGNVEIILETKTNGKLYQAKLGVSILDANRYIRLSNHRGTIYLDGSRVSLLTYTLVGLSGKVTVTVGNEDIASVTVEDGVLKVTGKKAGKTDITVSVTENGHTYSDTYHLTVEEKQPSQQTSSKKHDSSLRSLKPSKGSIPFQSGVYDYYLFVDSSVKEFTLDAVPNDKNAKVKYWFNGESVDSLEDLELKPGENEVVIEVTAEDGSKSEYHVHIYKENSENNTLDDLKVSEGKLEPKFQSDVLHYDVTVDSTVDSIDIYPEVHDSKSKVTYKYNGEVVDDLNDLPLDYGDNEVEIEVTDENGNTRTYTVTVHRKERKVVLDREEYHLYVDENGKSVLLYHVYEDGVELEPGSYDPKDIEVDFPGYQGDYTVKDGYIVFEPEEDDFDKEFPLTLGYEDSETETGVTFQQKDYFLRTPTDHLEGDITSENAFRSFVLQSNLFTGEVDWKETEDGIRIFQKDNPDIYIDVSFDKDNLTVHSVEGKDSIAVEVEVKKEGDYQFHVKGFVPGITSPVDEFNIQLHVTRKYLLKLDANGGIINSFTSQYEFQLDRGETFDLSTYLDGYRVDEDCNYYAIVEFNTSPDGKGTSYKDTISITEDTVLYAIYSDTPLEEVPAEEKTLYLVDVDLFHNEEYFNLYGEDKVIYPGAHGSYIMRFTNETGNDIKIQNISLTEDTICIDGEGCLNMGYVIKDHQGTYYYGTGDHNYQLLASHTERNMISVPIPLAVGETAEISLLWEWIDYDDVFNNHLDTMIGNLAAANVNDTLYSLTVGIHYETIPRSCEREPGQP